MLLDVPCANPTIGRREKKEEAKERKAKMRPRRGGRGSSVFHCSALCSSLKTAREPAQFSQRQTLGASIFPVSERFPSPIGNRNFSGTACRRQRPKPARQIENYWHSSLYVLFPQIHQKPGGWKRQYFGVMQPPKHAVVIFQYILGHFSSVSTQRCRSWLLPLHTSV